MKCEIKCLGNMIVSVNGDSSAWEAKRSTKAGMLLKILLTRPNTFIHVDQLIDSLWGKKAPVDAEGAIRTNIHHIRSFLEQNRTHDDPYEIIQRREGVGYGIFSSDACWIDVVSFEDAVSQARELYDTRSLEESVGCYERAFKLYKGEFLEDDEYEDWALDRRSQLESQYIEVCEILSVERGRHENHYEAISYAERAIAIAPGNERLSRQLMSSYCATGGREKAIATYTSLAAFLKDISANPETETEMLYKKILSGELSPSMRVVQSDTEIEQIKTHMEERVFSSKYIWGIGSGLVVVLGIISVLLFGIPFPADDKSSESGHPIKILDSTRSVLVQGTPIEAPEGLIAWWDGDSFSDDLSMARDLIGENHGVIQGNVLQDDGVVGRAFNFAGGFSSRGEPTAQIIVPPSEELDITGPITIEFWAKVNDLNRGNDNTMISKGSFYLDPGDPPVTYSVSIGGVDHEAFGYYEWADEFAVMVGGPFPEDGEFHHVAYVRTEDQHVIIIDGEAVGVNGIPTDAGSSINVGLAIGGSIHESRVSSDSGICCHFNGIIDEVSIYNRTLSIEEIRSIYEAGSAGKVKPEN